MLPIRSFCLLATLQPLLWLATEPTLYAQSPGSPLRDPSRRLDTVDLTPASSSLAESSGLVVSQLEEENLFAPSSPGDRDIGDQLILKETPRQRPFRVLADGFAFWTDNAGNTPAGQVSDVFWGSQLRLGWQPRIARRWFADIDVSQSFFRYDEFDVLDFEIFEANANIVHILPRVGNILLFAGPQYRRMSNNTFQDDLLNSFSIRGGVQKIFLIDRRNSIHFSALGDWDIETDVDQVFRHEYIGELAWRFKIMRDLIVTTSYRFTWFDYTRVPREDALSLVGLSINWMPKRWLEVYATANYSYNDSNIDFFDYETTTLGGGLGVKIRF